MSTDNLIYYKTSIIEDKKLTNKKRDLKIAFSWRVVEDKVLVLVLEVNYV